MLFEGFFAQYLARRVAHVELKLFTWGCLDSCVTQVCAATHKCVNDGDEMVRDSQDGEDSRNDGLGTGEQHS